MSIVSRRQFLAAYAAMAPAVLLTKTLRADVGAPRALHFTHTHTGRRLNVEYFNGGRYQTDALAEVNEFLCDFRTGDVHPIDPKLLDLLHHLASTADTIRPFQVISGYRSPATNELLRSRSEGVAAGSLHMTGQAIDIRLTGVPLARLRTLALDARIGGVGYYPASDFVHVDTGRFRRW